MTFIPWLRAVSLAFCLLCINAKVAEAATILLLVNSTADSDMPGFCTSGTTCTIRTAFRLANENPADTFNVDIPINTYNVVGGHLSLTAGRINLRGQGLSPGATILRRSSGGRLIQVNKTGSITPVLSLFNLTMRDADVSNDSLQGSGSAVNSFNGSITIDRVFFLSNKSFFRGGAIGAHGGSVFITRSRFVGNQITINICAGGFTGVGGAVFATSSGSTPGNLSIHQSEFTDNVSTCRGGAIGMDGGGNFFLINSVVSGNSAVGQGGGVQIVSSNTTPTKAFLRLSTIANNTVSGSLEGISGGGLALRGLSNSTPEIRSAFGMLIASNAGAGDNADCGVVATVPTAPVDMQGNVVGKIGNCGAFLGTPSANPTRIGTTSSAVNPLISTLTTFATNYTFTMRGHIPQSGSPALGFQFNTSAGTICGDQRQFNRPQCLSRKLDIGSFEANGTP